MLRSWKVVISVCFFHCKLKVLAGLHIWTQHGPLSNLRTIFVCVNVHRAGTFSLQSYRHGWIKVKVLNSSERPKFSVARKHRSFLPNTLGKNDLCVWLWKIYSGSSIQHSGVRDGVGLEAWSDVLYTNCEARAWTESDGGRREVVWFTLSALIFITSCIIRLKRAAELFKICKKLCHLL